MSKFIMDPHIKTFQTMKGLRISWNDLSYLTGFTKYILLRKQYDYPNFIDDGEVILDGVNTTVVDMNAEAGKSYYYVLYCVTHDSVNNVNSYLTNNLCRFNKLVTKIGENTDRMYDSLPGLYIIEDKKINSDIPQPLYRFMKIMGFQFDKVEQLINHILNNIDIDSCDEIFLPTLAKWLGITYDWSLPITDNRILTKLMVENYGIKGTYDGLLSLLQNISKAKVVITMDKTKTLRTATTEEIANRRRINVIVTIPDGNESWFLSRKDKVTKIISKNVPSRNSSYINLLIDVGSFIEKYEKIISSYYSNINISEKFTDGYLISNIKETEKYNIRYIIEVDIGKKGYSSSEKDMINEVVVIDKFNNIKRDSSIDVISYIIEIDSRNPLKSVEIVNKDNVSEKFVDTYILKRNNDTTDDGGVRGSSLWGYNTRGSNWNIVCWDEITNVKTGVVQKRYY